jgi:DNA (cytosine-5)-methyltransferase 1
MTEQTLYNPKTPDDSQREVDSSATLCSHLDLFSGIGGFALAAKWHGMETVAFCEIDPWARRVLNKNFPGVPIHEDVKQLSGKKYEGIDLITGGYPCQPFSLAGKRHGEGDDRHLWPEVFRIIKEARPRWVLCENVAGHVTMGLDQVLSDLGSEGYTGEPIIIPACAKNAQHRRDRVWIIAHSGGAGLQGAERKGSASEEGQPIRHTAELDQESVSGDTSSGRRQGSGRAIEPVNTTSNQDRETDQFIYELGWPDEPPVCRGVDGVSRRMDANRLRGLGNAIVPAIAYEIMNCMILADEPKINPAVGVPRTA